MFVDIHTHNKIPSSYPSIQNLALSEVEAFLLSSINGTFSFGFHPWFANDCTDELMITFEKWALDSRMVAIGECGLDKNSKACMATQIDVFSKQIYVSENLQKPLIVHCVGCFNELFEIKETLKPQQLWIIHGFRGKPALAKQALKNGCALSYGQNFNSESVIITPFNKLFIETDESKLSIEEMYTRVALSKACTPALLTAGFEFYSGLMK